MRADAIPVRSPPAPGVIAWTLFGLAAGPAGWIIQLSVDYGLASYACFPRYEPWTRSPPPGWSAETTALCAISLACLVLTLAGAAVSARLYRTARGRGRRREAFLAACGTMASIGFTVSLLFDTWPLLREPTCWSIPL